MSFSSGSQSISKCPNKNSSFGLMIIIFKTRFILEHSNLILPEFDSSFVLKEFNVGFSHFTHADGTPCFQ